MTAPNRHPREGGNPNPRLPWHSTTPILYILSIHVNKPNRHSCPYRHSCKGRNPDPVSRAYSGSIMQLPCSSILARHFGSTITVESTFSRIAGPSTEEPVASLARS